MQRCRVLIPCLVLLQLLVGCIPAGDPPAGNAEQVSGGPDRLTGPAAAPMPEAWDYVRMEPIARYELRRRANSLTAQEYQEHVRALRQQVDSLPDWVHEGLHYERAAMNCAHGTVTPLPPPRMLDAWEHVDRLPHHRHDDRIAAAALPPAEREAYEAHMATELARLPEWLRASLDEETERLDRRYGLEQCPGE